MKNIQHDIEGIFHLFESSVSKRSNPVCSGFRPQHKIHLNYLSSGEHHYLGTESVHPGQKSKVYVKLITPHVYPNSLWVGRKLEISEGAQIIGELEITKINNSLLLGSPSTYNPTWSEANVISNDVEK